MVSRRARSKNTLGTRLENFDSKIKKIEQSGSDTPALEIEENGVTQREIAPGAVGTKELGAVDEIVSGSSVNIKAPNGVLVNGVPLSSVSPSSNKILNSNFRTNQRAYTSGTGLAQYTFAFDRWRTRSTGTTTLTFTAQPQGQTITINANKTIGQDIEREEIPAGVYLLSWEGTVKGRIYQWSASIVPSYAVGPIKAVFDGTQNVIAEFLADGSDATLGKVVLERVYDYDINRVLDPGFNDAAQAWSLNSALASQSTDRSHSGLYSLKVDRNGGGGGDDFAWTNVIVKPSTTYTISGWVWLAGGGVTAPAGRGLLVHDYTGGGVGSIGYDYSLVNQWQYVSLSLKTGPTTTGINVRFYSIADASIYVDDVMVTDGPTPFPGRVPVPSPYREIPIADELVQCWRHYRRVYGGVSLSGGTAAQTTIGTLHASFQPPMRGGAAVGIFSQLIISDDYAADYTAASPTITGATSISAHGGRIQITGFTGLTVGRWYGPIAGTGYIEFTADL